MELKDVRSKKSTPKEGKIAKPHTILVDTKSPAAPEHSTMRTSVGGESNANNAIRKIARQHGHASQRAYASLRHNFTTHATRRNPANSEGRIRRGPCDAPLQGDLAVFYMHLHRVHVVYAQIAFRISLDVIIVIRLLFQQVTTLKMKEKMVGTRCRSSGSRGKDEQVKKWCDSQIPHRSKQLRVQLLYCF